MIGLYVIKLLYFSGIKYRRFQPLCKFCEEGG